MGVGAMSDHNRSGPVLRVRTRRTAPPLVLGLLLVMLLGLLVSCGRAPTDSPSTDDNGSVSSTSSAAGDSDAADSDAGANNGGGTGSGGNGGGGGRSGDDKGVAWVPFGPQDPSFPTPTWPVYNAFASGDCSRLASVLPSNDVGDYGQLMLAVCQAAIDGQSDKWDTAESLADADAGSLGNGCVEPLVQGAVERALTWHRDHPDLAPRVELHPTGDQTECGAQAASENDQQDGDEDAGDSSDTGGTSASPTDQSPSDVASSTP
jgi:hypothetical protein